ncbi:MAG: DUF4421 domain-containing protein [Chitinophagaceae bacterium]
MNKYLNLPALISLNTFFFIMVVNGLGQDIAQPNHDTTYYKSFQQSIIARVYLSQKYTTLELKKGNDAPRLRYRPNTNLNIGFGATYRNLSINIAKGFGFMNNDDEKGKVKKLDLQFRLYSRKWAIDGYGQFYKQYYVYPKGRGNADNKNYYIRPDLKVNLAGISAYRIFNFNKFTLHPAFTQDEVQLKSAGSLLAGAEIYYGNIKGDSALVPSTLFSFYDRRSISNVRILEIGPGVGYAYTLVLPYHFYATGSVNVNVNFGLVKETGMNTGSANHVSANANMLYRVGAGYNDGEWNVNAFWVNTRFAAKGSLSGNSYILNAGNFRLIFSKRLQPGPKLKKLLRPLDRVLRVN